MKRRNNISQRTAIRSTVLMWLTATLLLAGCNKDQGLSAPESNGELEVRLMIDTKQAQTRADADDVSVINTLRVYVFKVGSEDLVGYSYEDNLQKSGSAYYLPLRLQTGGELEFFVLANEGNGLTYGSGTSAKALDENISHDALHALAFSRANITNGALMSGWVTENITGTQGVTVVECPLTRDVAEMNLYFATTGGAVQITSVTLHDYKTESPVFWGNQNNTTTEGNTYNSDNGTLLTLLNNNDFPTISENTANNLDDYKQKEKVATTYLVKNSEGSAVWDQALSTTKNPRLEIAYTVDGNARTATVYLPPIAINHRYNICCLVKAAGILLNISIDDWEEAGYAITWTDESNITFGPEMEGEYRTEVIHESDMAGGQKAGFKISAGQDNSIENVEWQATIDNVQDFTFVDEEGKEVTSPTGMLKKEGEYIRVKPTKTFDSASENGTKIPQCRLQIKLKQADGTWLVCSLPWEPSSTKKDFILITQVKSQSSN